MLNYTLYKESRNFKSDEYMSVKWIERPWFMQSLDCKTELIKGPCLISHFKTTKTPILPSTNFLCVSLFHSTDPSNYKHNEDTLGVATSFDVEYPEEPSICLWDPFQDNIRQPIFPGSLSSSPSMSPWDLQTLSFYFYSPRYVSTCSFCTLGL